MSGDTNKNWSVTAMVVGLCAAIGFGAVYAMVGGGDNRAERSTTENKPAPTVASKPIAPAGSLTNQASTQTAKATTGAAATTAALSGTEGRPLNRGAMTTFVFKKQAREVAKPPTFNGPDGKPMVLADLKGKVILLNLWATWCAPCRKEMPHLDQLQRELGSDQFEVVALSVDRGSPDKAKKFLTDLGLKSLKFYHDPTAQAGFSFMAIGMPTTLLFDRAGREIGRLVGPAEWHSQDAKNLINAAIAAG